MRVFGLLTAFVLLATQTMSLVINRESAIARSIRSQTADFNDDLQVHAYILTEMKSGNEQVVSAIAEKVLSQYKSFPTIESDLTLAESSTASRHF
jgi:hypothetical protein